MTTNHELPALVTLFLDPDPEIHLAVRDRLWEIGEAAIPHLDACRVKTADGPERKRLEDLILDLAFSDISDEFSLILASGMSDVAQLERAVLQISRIEDPTLRIEQVTRKLDAMADAIRASLAISTMEPEQNEQGTKAFLESFFSQFDFKGDTDTYFDPTNAFLHTVLERRRGMPLTIAMIALFIARRLEIPLFGVNMPIHFLLMYVEQGKRRYIDPFDRGEVLSLHQCAVFLKRNGILMRPEHMAPARPAEILVRLLRNLEHATERIGDQGRSFPIHQLLLAAEQMLDEVGARVEEDSEE